MLEALWIGLEQVFSWPAIGYLMLGVMVGIWLGAVPGLGGIIGLVLLLPFTFGMDPVPAFALLLGMFAVTTTSDTIASVMLGIPGTAASQATILDGHPLAQKGQAARALGAAYTVSAFGGVFGALVLAVSLPLIMPIILAFGSPELFMLGVLGLAMVGSLGGGNVLKGLTVATLGLFISTIGYSETVAIPRFWFGLDYLLDGVPLIPMVLGLFAVPEVMELAVKNVSISRVAKIDTEQGGIMDGVRDAMKHWWLATRCAALGAYVGIIPGLGAAIVDWLAYGHAVQSAKDKSQFGQGDIRGVIAPEAANNATRGGGLIPMVTLGIPGTLGTAILMGALLIQGLRPGRDMLTTELPLTFSMVWSIVVANIVVAILLMIWSKQVAKIAFVPGHLLVPGVMVLVFMGAWLGGSSIGDWVTLMIMGVVGFAMKRGGWPRPPMILGLVLGDILENAFQVSMRAYDGPGWLGRPLVLIIVALVVVTLFYSIRAIARTRKMPNAPATGEGNERNAVLSLPLTVALLALYLWASIDALQWPVAVKQFPLVTTVPGLVLLAIVLVGDLRAFRRETAVAGSVGMALSEGSARALLPRTIRYFGYLILVPLLTLAVGQKIALVVFVLLYLARWTEYSWRINLAYAAGAYTVIVVFYDRILHLFWHPSWLADLLVDRVPAWFPGWLVF